MLIYFIIGKSVQSEVVDDSEGRRAGSYCTADEEVCENLQTQQIPTMQNSLQKENRFPRLANLGKRYLGVCNFLQ